MSEPATVTLNGAPASIEPGEALVALLGRHGVALEAVAVAVNLRVVPRSGLGEVRLRDGDRVEVRSRRGAIRLAAQLTDREIPGSVFVPFHFREAAANLLTLDELDPDGKIPEFKFCAARIEKVPALAAE